MRLINKIDTLGGAVSAIEQEFQQNEIANSAYEFQKGLDAGDNIVVGVNKFTVDEKEREDLQNIDPKAVQSQLQRLKITHQSRDENDVGNALSSLESAAKGDENIMPHIVHAVKQYATLGEISDILRSEFGEHQ